MFRIGFIPVLIAFQNPTLDDMLARKRRMIDVSTVRITSSLATRLRFSVCSTTRADPRVYAAKLEKLLQCYDKSMYNSPTGAILSILTLDSNYTRRVPDSVRAGWVRFGSVCVFFFEPKHVFGSARSSFHDRKSLFLSRSLSRRRAELGRTAYPFTIWSGRGTFSQGR